MGFVQVENSLHLGEKICWIFVRGHYPFREANSFPRKTVSFEEQWRYVQGQITQHIFAPNGGYFVHYPSNLFRNHVGAKPRPKCFTISWKFRVISYFIESIDSFYTKLGE